MEFEYINFRPFVLYKRQGPNAGAIITRHTVHVQSTHLYLCLFLIVLISCIVLALGHKVVRILEQLAPEQLAIQGAGEQIELSALY